MFWKKKPPQTHGGPTIEERQRGVTRAAKIAMIDNAAKSRRIRNYTGSVLKKMRLHAKWAREDGRDMPQDAGRAALMPLRVLWFVVVGVLIVVVLVSLFGS